MITSKHNIKKHKEFIQKGQEAIESKKEEVKKHPWYLGYHISPPANWMNDPNGFCYYQGEYHLFYQHYPYNPSWGPMHWGHFKSNDLVFWDAQPIALAPGEHYDADGCFSGSAIEVGDKLYIFYTGHVLAGPDSDHDLRQTQALAFSKDGVIFEKYENNPIISELPEGDFHAGHFRDPKVWKYKEDYYLIAGAKTKDSVHGQVVLYKSKDLIHWDFISVVAKAQGNQGTMWECPDLFELDGKHVLVVSPQGIEPEGIYYHNHHQSGYFIGDFNYDNGKLTHGQFQLFDYGFDFYAPQTIIDSQGRRILIAWMMMWESEMPTKEFGWAGAMTIPRVLEKEGDKLRMKPIPELEKLRENEVAYQNIIFNGETTLSEVSGKCIEIEMEVDLRKATEFGLKMRWDRLEQEATLLHYDVFKGLLTLDRNHSGVGVKGTRSVELKPKKGLVKFHIFMDSSSVEIFVNDGELSLTARIYPKETSEDICFYSNEDVEIVQIKKWKLKKVWN